MSYSELITEYFFYFTKAEEEAIKKYLEEKGYDFSRNTVCGNCCDMFSDVYYIRGNWKLEEDRTGLHELLKLMGCEHSIYSKHIDADPSAGSDCEDRLSYGKT